MEKKIKFYLDFAYLRTILKIPFASSLIKFKDIPARNKMITVVVLTFILAYLIYKYKWMWYHRHAIYNTIIKMIFKNKNKDNSIELRDTYAIITYYLDGDKYSIRVPRNPKHRLNPARMILILHDGIEIDITHKHGIPYFLSATDLGGVNITKRVYEENVSQFCVNEVPYL